MDKRRYHERVKRALEEQGNLTIAQGEASRFSDRRRAQLRR
jgi:tRNA U34 5-carboxymethylaminomethyl modifying enzyme MnmG/GidA